MPYAQHFLDPTALTLIKLFPFVSEHKLNQFPFPKPEEIYGNI